MTRWEYKTLKLKASNIWGPKIEESALDNSLNDLGNQGWELVTAFDTNVYEGSTQDIIAIFKRPVS